MRTDVEESHLKKRIGFFGLLAMSVGINIGGALFALTTVAAGLSGPSLPLAMLITATPALLAIIPYGMLSSALPTTSGTYRYAQIVSPTVAIISMLTLAVCIVIGGQPLYALAFGKYLKELIPVGPVWAGLAVLTIFYVINLLGIEPTIKVQSFLFVLLFAALMLYIAMGLPHVTAPHFINPFPNGVGGLLAASGLMFTFCTGGFFIVDVGGEVIRARKIFPRVLLWAIILVVIIYLCITTVTVGVTDALSLEKASLTEVAENFMGGGALSFFIAAGALVACATTINGVFTLVARGLMVVSEEGLLPRFLGRVNERFGTPHWALTVPFIISAISLVTIPSLMFFGSMLNLGLIFAMVVIAIAGMKFPKKYPEHYANSAIKLPSRLLKLVCGAFIGMSTLIFVFLMIAIKWASLGFVAIVAAIAIFALFKSKTLRGIKNYPYFSRVKPVED